MDVDQCVYCCLCDRFSLFWICMFIFIAVVCIVNRCSKKNRQVDFRSKYPNLLPTHTDTWQWVDTLSLFVLL